MEDPDGKFKYGNFMLKPQTIDVDLANTEQLETKSSSPTIPVREKTDTEKNKDTNNGNTVSETVEGLINDVRHPDNRGKGTYSGFKLLSEKLLKIALFVTIVLIILLFLKVCSQKREYDREGYRGSKTGEFELDQSKMMNDTSRSIEITDFEVKKPIEFEMSSYQTEEEEKYNDFEEETETGDGSEEETQNEGYAIE